MEIEVLIMKYKTKKQANPKPPVCPYCGYTAVLKRAQDIYGEDTKWIADEFVYVCKNYPHCDSYISTKRGTKIPKGTMANGDLRHLRIQAHRVFDRIWLSGLMDQSAAYRWMQSKFNLTPSDAHIAKLSNYMCGKLIEASNEFLENNKIPKAC